MRKTIVKSIGIGIMLILSIAIVILGYYATIVPEYPENEDVILNTSPQIDTIEVIIEYDGDRQIRWYTLDTIKRIRCTKNYIK